MYNNSFTSLINSSIEQDAFPSHLKKAEVIPVFKKGDARNEGNYKPVSILACIPKMFESILIDQLDSYISPLMSTRMSVFRKGYSCQTVLTDIVETCKNIWTIDFIRCCTKVNSKSCKLLTNYMYFANRQQTAPA